MHRNLLSIFAIGVCLTCLSTPAEAQVQGRQVFASAPIGVGEQQLGRPYDGNFQGFLGKSGKTLFKAALKTPLSAQVDAMTHELVVIEDTRELSANASGWGVSGSIGSTRNKRYAYFRAWQVKAVQEVDDTVDMTPAPVGAVYYLKRIYYGHAYQVVLTGDRRSFHAGVKADFLVAKGDIKGFASKHKLHMKVVGRGLKPRGGKALFADSQDGVESSYDTTGKPVPIFVEYALLPGAKHPPASAVQWTSDLIAPGEYTLKELSVWVGPRDNGEKSWDAFNGPPDPMVQVTLDGAHIFACQRKNIPVGSPTTCEVDRNITIHAQSILGIRVVDKDPVEHDEIGFASVVLVNSGKPCSPIELQTQGFLNKVTVLLQAAP